MTRFVYRSSLLAVLVACLPSCSPSGGTDGSVAQSGLSACGEGDAPIAGVTYDVSKSRLAFGGAPVESTDPMGKRWTGPSAWVVSAPNGWTSGLADGTEASRPSWSSDPSALTERTRAYFVSFGLRECQIGASELAPHGSFSAPLPGVAFTRSVDGIPVVESKLSTRLTDDEHTSAEALFWPAIPRDVFERARAFRDRLSDPAELAAYKKSLPPLIRDNGQGVVLHHTAGGGQGSVRFAATWDVTRNGAVRSFDEDGVEIALDSL